MVVNSTSDEGVGGAMDLKVSACHAKNAIPLHPLLIPPLIGDPTFVSSYYFHNAINTALILRPRRKARFQRSPVERRPYCGDEVQSAQGCRKGIDATVVPAPKARALVLF